jgi:hypothetical protein
MGGLQSSKNVGNSNYQRSGQGRWVNVRWQNCNDCSLTEL